MPGSRLDVVGRLPALFRRSQPLSDQRTLPDTKQQFLELIEIPGSEFGTPFELDVAQDVDDFCIRSMSSPGEADNSRTTLLGRIGPGDITEILKASEDPVHGLLAHAGAFSESTGTGSIGAGKLQRRHVRHAQAVKSGSVELLNDTALDGLRGNAEQRADEHLCRFDRRIFFV